MQETLIRTCPYGLCDGSGVIESDVSPGHTEHCICDPYITSNDDQYE